MAHTYVNNILSGRDGDMILITFSHNVDHVSQIAIQKSVALSFAAGLVEVLGDAEKSKE